MGGGAGDGDERGGAGGAAAVRETRPVVQICLFSSTAHRVKVRTQKKSKGVKENQRLSATVDENESSLKLNDALYCIYLYA